MVPHKRTYWSLLNTESNARIDALTLDDVREVIAPLRVAELSQWYVREASANVWTPLLDKIKFIFSPVFDFEHDQDMRLSRRFANRYAVSVYSNQEKFDCFTIDVSLTGLKLTMSLPEFEAEQFRVTLKNEKDQAIDLICTVVDAEVDHRDRLRILRFSQLSLFESWLAG